MEEFYEIVEVLEEKLRIAIAKVEAKGTKGFL